MKINLKKISILTVILFIFLSPISIELNQTQPIDTTSSTVGVNDKITQIGSTEINLILNSANALELPGCNGLNPQTYGTCLANGILTFYEIIFYMTSQFLLVLVGLITDAFIGFSISSNFYRSSGIIEAGWEILRDLTNIVFIFALLTTAFKLVLGSDSSGVKKTLIKTMLVALVINFSLFMSYAIIDGSNILAHVFYNKIDADVSNYSPNVTDSDGNTEDVDSGGINLASYLRSFGVAKSPSIAIAAQINPQRIVNKSGTTNFFVAFLLVTMASVMNWFMIWVFGSIILIFLGRILGLIVLTILSPLAFASLTVPSLRNIPYVGWDKWFPDILKLSFTAPIYLFFLWLTVTFVGNEGVLAILNQPDVSGSYIDEILNVFILMMLIGGILYLAKKVTTTMAGDLGNLASKAVGGAIGGAVAIGAIAATGGAALAGGAMRGVGAVTGNAKTIARGKRLMSFKADVTKLPGFKNLAGGTVTDIASKLTNTSGRDIERKSTLGVMKGKEAFKDWKGGRKFEEGEFKYEKDKEKIENESGKWQDKINEEKASIELEKVRKAAEESRSSNPDAAGNTYKQHLTNMQRDASRASGSVLKAQKDQTELLKDLIDVEKTKAGNGDATADIAGAKANYESYVKGTYLGRLEQAEKDVKTVTERGYAGYASRIEGSGENGGRKTAAKIRSGKIKPKAKEDDDK